MSDPSGHPPAAPRPPRKRPTSRRTPPSQNEIVPTKNALFWAARYPGVKTGNERLALMTLADRWNPEQHCTWPSHETIAQQACMSVSALKTALNGLRAQGTVDWREMHRRGHKGRDGSPNCYVFPPYDSHPPLPDEKFVLHETARPGRKNGDLPASRSKPAGSAATSSSVASKLKLGRHPAEVGAGGAYEVPSEGPSEVPTEAGTTSDGSRRPTSRAPRTPAGLAGTEEGTQPATRSLRAGDRDGKLNPAAERADSPHGCAQRLKIKLLAHPNRYVAPVNVKALSSTLAQWHGEGTSIEVIREMVDIFADSPARYGAKDANPWYAFINARQKLLVDAGKRLGARASAGRGSLYERATSGDRGKTPLSLREMLSGSDQQCRGVVS